MKAGTNLEKILENGMFAVTAEAGPPKGTSAAVVLRKGELLHNCCDAVNITDNQIDRVVYDLYGLTPEEIEMIEQRVSIGVSPSASPRESYK